MQRGATAGGFNHARQPEWISLMDRSSGSDPAKKHSEDNQQAKWQELRHREQVTQMARGEVQETTRDGPLRVGNRSPGLRDDRFATAVCDRGNNGLPLHFFCCGL